MMRTIAIALILTVSPAWGAEPIPGPISPVGAAIEVESWRCEVTSQRSLQCLNIGRVCADYRAKERAHSDRIFGCAIKGSKNYPCPPDDPLRKVASQCWPLTFGGL